MGKERWMEKKVWIATRIRKKDRKYQMEKRKGLWAMITSYCRQGNGVLATV
jgi:hypothetical protein